MSKKFPAGVIRWFTQLSRPSKQAITIATDAVLLMFAAWAAYAIRLSYFFLPDADHLVSMALAPVLAVPVFLKMGLYRSVIRYIGEHLLWSVLKGMALATMMWSAAVCVVQASDSFESLAVVTFLYGLLGLVLISGSRFAARWLLWWPVSKRFAGRQVLIYGAGNAGRQLAVTLQRGRDMFPAGFLDDDAGLQGKDIDGLRVYAPSQLPQLIERFEIHDVVVTLPTASSARRREVVNLLEQHPLRVRILPAMADIANGRHLVNMVREVDIGDLLGRDPVVPDSALLGECIAGKNVLVTGAGGSIGAELCRQIVAVGPAKLVLLEVSEFALYQIERAIRSVSAVEVVPVLGSVQDARLVGRIFAIHAVQTVYHTAAHKHVPLVEGNVVEGVKNNVLGTLRTARAAFEAHVETFVLISTDKAVRPTNVMGASKRWAELIVQDLAFQARQEGRRQIFCAVRFGNVLGSSGSVIPLFKEQIAQGGPVTVTHSEVTRYFMSIHEAVQLVIQAGSLAEGGEVFLLDMGDPVKILDLACNMIRLAGHTVRGVEDPEGDIEIVFTGLRPGEKLYEELLIGSSNAEGTVHPKIMKASEPLLDTPVLQKLLDQLVLALEQGDEQFVRRVLSSQAPER